MARPYLHPALQVKSWKSRKTADPKVTVLTNDLFPGVVVRREKVAGTVQFWAEFEGSVGSGGRGGISLEDAIHVLRHAHSGSRKVLDPVLYPPTVLSNGVVVLHPFNR